MPPARVTRRGLMGAAGGLVTTGLVTAGRDAAAAQAPFALRFLDTTENGSERMMLDLAAALRPELRDGMRVDHEHVEYLFGGIREAIAAGQPPYDLVMTTLEGVMMGAELGLWHPMGDRLQPLLPPMDDLLTPLARLLRGAVREQAQIVAASPGGPLLAYAPDRMSRPPRSAEELLAFARENPGRFIYSRPEFSEAGRCFVAGLPWILGDRDPLDPEEGWSLTWGFLAELDRHVAYYPTTTRASMEELAEGGADIAATTLGVDFAMRSAGLLSQDIGMTSLTGMRWVPVGHFVAVPRGLPVERVDALAHVIADLLQEPFQRLAGRSLYWPSAVRQGISLDDLPPEIQLEVRRVARPGTPALVAAHPLAPPLLLEEMLTMLRRWDEDISAWHGVRP